MTPWLPSALPGSDKDIYKAKTYRRNVCQQLMVWVSGLFGFQ